MLALLQSKTEPGLDTEEHLELVVLGGQAPALEELFAVLDEVAIVGGNADVGTAFAEALDRCSEILTDAVEVPVCDRSWFDIDSLADTMSLSVRRRQACRTTPTFS